MTSYPPTVAHSIKGTAYAPRATCTTHSNQQPADKSPPESALMTKALTNFSIDSIIGHESSVGGQYGNLSDQREEYLTMEMSQHGHVNPSQESTQISATQESSCQVNHPKKYRPKNFQCPACRMAFSNNGQLKNHVRIHTGERPFRCNQAACNKTFTRNEELTRHKLIHTGVRPHACPSCFKRFGRKDHLKKHVRTHERRKLRKRVYVPSVRHTKPPSRASNNNCQLNGDRPIYSPPSKTINIKRERAIPASLMTPPVITSGSEHTLPILSLPMTSLPAIGFNQFGSFVPSLAPVTLAQHLTFGDSPARTMTSLAISNSLTACGDTDIMAAATTGEALRHLAGDYWQKWYSFLGFCRQKTIESGQRM